LSQHALSSFLYNLNIDEKKGGGREKTWIILFS